VRDDFTDLLEVGGPMEFVGVRCLNCGFVEDAVIFSNRHNPLRPDGVLPSRLARQRF